MRHTTAFLVLLGCLTGGALAQTDTAAASNANTTTDYADAGQPCTTPAAASPSPNPLASQNQIEYRG